MPFFYVALRVHWRATQKAPHILASQTDFWLAVPITNTLIFSTELFCCPLFFSLPVLQFCTTCVLVISHSGNHSCTVQAFNVVLITRSHCNSSITTDWARSLRTMQRVYIGVCTTGRYVYELAIKVKRTDQVSALHDFYRTRNFRHTTVLTYMHVLDCWYFSSKH